MDGVYLPHGFEADVKTKRPAEGATVAADLPDGTRVEQTTEVDGTVRFEDVGWSHGTASVTAYLKGYRMVTHLGVKESDGKQTLVLVGAETASTTTVRARLRNAPPTANYFALGASTPSWSIEGSWFRAFTETGVEQGRPFTAIGMVAEWFERAGQTLQMGDAAWVLIEHEGSTEPIDIELDFGGSVLTEVRAAGTVWAPSQGPAKEAPPRGWIRARGGSLLLGLCASSAQSQPADPTEFSFSWRYVEPIDPTRVFTTYSAVVAGSDWVGSFVEVPGYPQDGFELDAFLPAPELITPSNASEAISWKAANDPDAIPTLVIGDPNRSPPPGTLPILRAWSWILKGKPGMTTATLPTLPSTAQISEIYGALPAPVRLFFMADCDETTQYCARYAAARSFNVYPASR
jgi:hypothetical protein